MFDRLQKKWKVNGWQLVAILCTFAMGGSLTGYASRRIMGVFGIEKDWAWILVYIIIVTLLWPVAVLLMSIPFGQYKFFINYLKKMGRRVRIIKQSESPKVGKSGDRGPGTEDRGQETGIEDLTYTARQTTNDKPQTINDKRLAIFASGAGSNAARIIEYFRDHPSIHIALIACNKPGAGVLTIAEKAQIPVLMIEKENFFRGDAYVNFLKENRIDLIILAGFLWKIPSALLKAYPGKIINIHPALLPGYGGKGMYGVHVHQAVIEAGDKESGITIHYVDDQYDHGGIIFQARCPVEHNDTGESLAKRIHQLEHEHYPRIIENLLIK